MVQCEICKCEGNSIMVYEDGETRVKLISCSQCGTLLETQRWEKEFF